MPPLILCHPEDKESIMRLIATVFNNGDLILTFNPPAVECDPLVPRGATIMGTPPAVHDLLRKLPRSEE